MTDITHAPSRSHFRKIIGYASLGLVIFLAITAVRGYRDLQLAKERAAEIEASIEFTEEEIDRLGRKIERLRDDPAMLERLAREELGLVKPGEVVLIMEPDPSTTRPHPPATTSSPAPSSGPPAPTSP